MDQGIINVAVLRKNIIEHKKRQNDEMVTAFRTRLVNAHSDMVNFLIDRIIEKSKSTLYANTDATGFKLWDLFDQYDGNLYGFNITTVLYGFWDANMRTFDRTLHKDAGLPETPIAEVIRVMEPEGYKIEDISDHKKSSRKVLSVRFIF